MYMSSEERRLARVTGRARASCERPAPRAVAKAVPPRKPSAAGERLDGEERRDCERIDLDSELMVRRIGGFNFQVRLENVSTAGCRIEMVEATEAGEAMIARFPALEPLGADICWTKGTTAGLNFSRPIHPAVFEALLGRLG
jgi:hypothetical protein